MYLNTFIRTLNTTKICTQLIHKIYTFNYYIRTDKKNGEDEEICNVMYIEQQNRNVTEEFTWNDASLLTGAMILGAEMCSDRKVDAQIKTQIEIDEEIGYAHDKLYPGDFKICVNPIVIGDIVTPKKYLDMEGCNKSNHYILMDSNSDWTIRFSSRYYYYHYYLI